MSMSPSSRLPPTEAAQDSLAPIHHLHKLVAPLLVLSCISNLAILVSPIFMMQVLDRVVPTGNLHTLLMLLLVATLVLLLQAVVDGLCDLSLQRAARWCERLSAPAVLSRPPEQQAEILTHLTALKASLLSAPAKAALSLPWLPLFVGILWAIHPWFAALAAGLLAVAAIIRILEQTANAPFAQHLIAARTAEQRAMGDAQTVSMHPGMSGLSQNIRTRLGQALRKRSKLEDKVAPLQVGTQAAESYLRSLSQLLGLSLGAALVVDGALSAGGMIAASLILTKTVSSFESVIGSYTALKSGLAGQRFLKNLPVRPMQPLTEVTDLQGRLRCEGLIFPRGGGAPPRLDRISFDLAPSECLIIVGASGSGKSTLLEALAGIHPCPIGTVWLDDTEVKTLPSASQARLIGYLPQQAQLYHGTLAQNIAGFAPDATDAAIIAAAQISGVHGLISALPKSYDTDIGATPHVLSAGQKQRIALARAIFNRPKYLFLDEPNALLDAAGERQLCAVLARLKKQGTTLVMVIHRSGLMGLADHILALENGRVADYGPRSDVLGRMSGGRRRLEVPLQTASLQDLADWVCAQFSRGSDADLSKRAELIATELFNLAMASGPQDTPRKCVFQFRFLNARSCEISLTEDRATGAAQKIQKVATLLRQEDANMGSLPKDEAAMAVITQLSDGFDIQNIDGKAMYRAAVSMRNLTLPKAIQH
ncbi:MAG: ATP-binding cassette domain-containing protein [Rhodobacteraceae bacterium]|nr:ATP-binding cassette domain-containing protein [Paracoccaceae bacterium]